MWTGNEFLYKLLDESRLCEELKEKGYNFKQREAARRRNPIDKEDQLWRGIAKERHFVMGYAAHGFHFRICRDAAFHESAETNCRCKKHGRRIEGPNHLETCPALDGSLYERYKHVLSD